MENAEAMEDDGSKDVQLSETKRVSRNMNEKRRRDRFNVLVGELAAVIPQSSSSGKLDKTTILKKAIAYLRNRQDLPSSNVTLCRPTVNWQPAFVSDSELNQLLLETMDSFLLILDGSGIINFVSDSILSILGYRPHDVINNSIADYLDQSDQSCVFAHLALMLEQLKTPNLQSSNSTSLSSPVSKFVNFEMTMTSGPCLDRQRVEIFSCTGQTFVTNHSTDGRPHATHVDGIKVQLMVVCSLTGPKASHMLPLSNITSKEFTSRLTLNWKFTYSDPQILDIIGFQPHELNDKSIYNFIHKDDLANVANYHKMLVRKGCITTCYYRFLTKGESWIWLRSCCYISYNQWSSKPEYITLTTRPINYEEVYANQEIVIQSDRLQFQNISKNLNSLKTASLASMKQRSNSAHSMPQYQASNDSLKTSDENQYGMLELPVVLQDNDSKGGTKPNSNPSESSNASKSMFSSFEAPEGLTPTQYKLHKQLQSKHVLLEKSIERQITELQKIKRQIEINKQLWEFNRQLQDKKAEKLSRSSRSCSMSDKSSDIASSYAPQDPIPEPLNSSATNYTIDIPANMYMSVPYIDPSIEQSSNPLNTSSHSFSPLQSYYQY